MAREGHGHPGNSKESHAVTWAPKTMGLEYFLEMVNSKHRHGSNLRAYHTSWKSSLSNQNFFYWLDYGEGKDVELPQCTRVQLEKLKSGIFLLRSDSTIWSTWMMQGY